MQCPHKIEFFSGKDLDHPQGFWGPVPRKSVPSKNVRMILVRGVNARLPPEAKKILKI